VGPLDGGDPVTWEVGVLVRSKRGVCFDSPPLYAVASESINPSIDADVARVVARVVEEVSPLRIVLFGSRALETAGPDSDVDLLIVVPDGERPLSVMRRLHRRIRGVGVPVDYVVATPDRLARHGKSIGYIYREALVHGREVYAADPAPAHV